MCVCVCVCIYIYVYIYIYIYIFIYIIKYNNNNFVFNSIFAVVLFLSVLFLVLVTGNLSFFENFFNRYTWYVPVTFVTSNGWDDVNTIWLQRNNSNQINLKIFLFKILACVLVTFCLNNQTK